MMDDGRLSVLPSSMAGFFVRVSLPMRVLRDG